MPYALTTLNDPLASGLTLATGVNQAGTVVGTYQDGAGTNHGFLYGGGVFTPIDVPLSIYTIPLGINDAGQVVGFFHDATGFHGFLDDQETFTTVDDPFSAANLGGTTLTGINNSGEIVGYYVDSSGSTHGFVDVNGAFTTIDVPSAGYTAIRGINNQGDIVGTYGDAAQSALHAFVLHNGQFTTIDDPQGVGTTQAGGINDAGTVSGTFHDATGQHGFVETGGVFTTIDGPGADGSVGEGVNDGGVDVGYYHDATGFHGYIATPQISAGEGSGFSLGDASHYALIAFAPHNFQGTSNSPVFGDVGVGPFNGIQLASDTIHGDLVTAGASPKTIGGTVTGVIIGDSPDLSADIAALKNLSQVFASEPGAALTLHAGDSITATQGLLDSHGNFVFTLSNWADNITIVGDASERVVINVPNSVAMRLDNLHLVGGITPDEVLFNDLSSTELHGVNGETFQGTVLAPYAKVNVNGVTLDGHLFGGAAGQDFQWVSGADAISPSYGGWVGG